MSIEESMMERENVNYIVINTNIIEEFRIINNKGIEKIYNELMRDCDYDINKILELECKLRDE